ARSISISATVCRIQTLDLRRMVTMSTTTSRARSAIPTNRLPASVRGRISAMTFLRRSGTISPVVVKISSTPCQKMRPTLRLLGSFRGETAARRALRLPTRKSRALLAYLALRPGQRQTRDAMTALLWGDTDDARARGSFRQALYSVRRAVGPRAIVIDGDGLTLVASALDVDATR